MIYYGDGAVLEGPQPVFLYAAALPASQHEEHIKLMEMVFRVSKAPAGRLARRHLEFRKKGQNR